MIRCFSVPKHKFSGDLWKKFWWRRPLYMRFGNLTEKKSAHNTSLNTTWNVQPDLNSIRLQCDFCASRPVFPMRSSYSYRRSRMCRTASRNAQLVCRCHWIGYCIRWPHQVPLLSAKIKKKRLQWARNHQPWTIEEWKNITWSDVSGFRMSLSHGRVRIWRKQQESCLVSTVQACDSGEMVWGMFSWHTLGPLMPIEQYLNATAYLNIVADQVNH